MKYRSVNSGTEIVKKDYRKKVIFSNDDFSEEGYLLQTVVIPPNTKQRMHFHNKLTEVFYILEGEAVITMNNEDYFAKPGDAFISSPGDVHNLWNKTDRDFKLVVFKINVPVNDEDTVWKD